MKFTLLGLGIFPLFASAAVPLYCEFTCQGMFLELIAYIQTNVEEKDGLERRIASMVSALRRDYLVGSLNFAITQGAVCQEMNEYFSQV